MIKELIKKYRRVWLIGIGGSGMCAIAEVLMATDFEVSGSDLIENEATLYLRELGAQIYLGHDSTRIKDCDVVIYSSAVSEDNPELQAAIRQKIPVIRRAEMLAELMRMKTGIAISGSHGKTTLTLMVGKIFALSKFDPTVLVGGRIRKLKTGVRAGGGEIVIAEADEFDQSFLKLTPTVVVVNNIDNDHLECYHHSYEELEDAFTKFANSIPFYGRSIICLDEPSLHPILPRLKRNVVTYGTSPQADIRGSEIKYHGPLTSFEVSLEGRSAGAVRLNLPGRFNVLNALGAIAVAHEFGIEFPVIRKALEEFEGVDRRFEIIGEVNEIMVVTDFGHHPTAISVTLEAAKASWKRPLIVVFQAHLYSRTQMLAKQFGQALLGAETVFVLPIYPAREKPVPGVTSQLIIDAARDLGHKNIHAVESKDHLVNTITDLAKPGDLVLVIGAGNVNLLAPEILKRLDV